MTEEESESAQPFRLPGSPATRFPKPGTGRGAGADIQSGGRTGSRGVSVGMSAPSEDREEKAGPEDAAARIPLVRRPLSRRKLVLALLESPHACASIARKDATASRAVDGVEAVWFAEDLARDLGGVGEELLGEPVLADQEVAYRGQPVAVVVGEDAESCRFAREHIVVDYHPEPGLLTLEHALAMKSFHGEARSIARGDAAEAIRGADNTLSGSLFLGPQTHRAEPAGAVEVAFGKNGEITASAPTLSPPALRSAVARVAGVPESSVLLDCPPLPGAMSGRETEPVRLAVLATLAALRTGASVSVLLDEGISPMTVSRRHAVQARFKAAYTDEGVLTAVDLRLAIDGGRFLRDSDTVLDRTLLHADAVYAPEHFHVRGALCRTNGFSSASLSAEGAAQGAWAMEEILDQVAARTGLPPHEVREKNLVEAGGGAKTAPCGQTVNGVAIHRAWNHVLEHSEFRRRREEIDRWNENNPGCKRGLAAVPVKFGFGDPRPERNAAAVLVQLLPDGSARVHTGAVDLLDGLEGQIREEVSYRLGIGAGEVRVSAGDFGTLPRAAPVTGVDGAGLILRALSAACDTLESRLREVALQRFAARGQAEVEADALLFANGTIAPENSKIPPLDCREVIEAAWRKRVSLSAIGFHRTPKLWWDRELGAGWPFSAFTHAAAVAEVQVDAFTGETQILRVDVAHEGSASAGQGERDAAQLYRAFALGADWMLPAEKFDPESEREGRREEGGRPWEGGLGFADAPLQWKADRLRPLGDTRSAPGDPCGEAPVLLAAALRGALLDALRAFGMTAAMDVELPLPVTPPELLSVFREISREADRLERENAAESKPTEGA